MKLIIKVFTREDCSQCPTAKNIAHKVAMEFGIELREFDIDTVDGLAEAHFHEVLSTPSIIIVDIDNDEWLELAGFRAIIPNYQELTIKIRNIISEKSEGGNNHDEENEIQSQGEKNKTG